jgi:hypothetical protein
MLEILQQLDPKNFAGMVTGDESWFFHNYSRNDLWRVADEKTPERIS